MKIFEYDWKNGKGKHIADARYSGCSARIGRHKGYPVHSSFGTIDYIDGKPVFEDHITADAYDRDAIIFCTGSWSEGDGPKKWEWLIVPNRDMAAKAKARNMAKYGHAHSK